EFVAADGRGPVLRTDRETTQPNRAAIAYWASGLEPVYLEGAFDRARRRDPFSRRPKSAPHVRSRSRSAGNSPRAVASKAPAYRARPRREPARRGTRMLLPGRSPP